MESQDIGLPVTESGLVLPCGASGRWSSSRSDRDVVASLLGGTFLLLLRTAVNGNFPFRENTLAWAGLREGEALIVAKAVSPSRALPLLATPLFDVLGM